MTIGFKGTRVRCMVCGSTDVLSGLAVIFLYFNYVLAVRVVYLLPTVLWVGLPIPWLYSLAPWVRKVYLGKCICT